MIGKKDVIPWLPVFWISGAALAYEVLLLRLFAIIQWHDFAYLVISLALLGHGVSGTVIVLLQRRLIKYYFELFTLNCLLFAVTSSLCFWLAQQVAFNSLEIIWQQRQWWGLAQIYMLLTIPFFFAANCITLSLVRFPHRIPALYSCDLLGAGAGGALVLLLLYLAPPDSLIQLLSASVLLLALFAAIQFSSCSHKTATRSSVIAVVVLLLLLIVTPSQLTDLKSTPYKALQKTLLLPGVQIEAEQYSPMGVLTVVSSPNIPLRLSSGLSLASTNELPQQMAIFIDGDGPVAINYYKADIAQSAYLADVSSALPYRFLNSKSKNYQILQLGLDQPSLLQTKLFLGKNSNVKVDVIEPNEQLIHLIQHQFNDDAGWDDLSPSTDIYRADIRSFLASSSKQYDLVSIQVADSSLIAGAGLNALKSDYRYTTEAFSEYYEHLSDDGMLSVTNWLAHPPRATLKILATVLYVLRKEGVENPAQHLIMIRSWKTATLLITKRPVTKQQIDQAKSFCEKRWFDLVYYPGVKRSEVNRYARLRQPDYFLAAKALINQPHQFYDQYKFAIYPANDDRPFFYQFFKWSSANELMALHISGGAALIGKGYPMLLMTLLLAVLMSVVLILLPLIFQKQNHISTKKTSEIAITNSGLSVKETSSDGEAASVLLYFFCLGMGFMFVEIAMIQRFVLFLSHPVISATVVIALFLIFAGLGSLFCDLQPEGRRIKVSTVITLLIGVVLLYLLLAPHLLQALVGTVLIIRILAVAFILAPIAFLMGMPFPLGLSGLIREKQYWIPWAWGINGCASVISTVLATLLALHFGFNAVIVLALLFYAVAARLRWH